MGGLFGKAPKAADPVKMPVADDAATLAAQERQRQQVAARSGRASTVMSRRAGNGRTGGDAGTSSYSNSLLGSAG